MLQILRLVTFDGTASEMVAEVEEEYSDDDDLSMLGPDPGRWWNYSEKGAGDDSSLEDINYINTYHEDTITSWSDKSVLEEIYSLRINF